MTHQEPQGTRYSWLKAEGLSNRHRLVDEAGVVVAEWNVARVGGRTTFTWGGGMLVITKAHLLTDNLIIRDENGARLAVYKGKAYEIKGRVVLTDKSVYRFLHAGSNTYRWADAQDTALVLIQPNATLLVPLKAYTWLHRGTLNDATTALLVGLGWTRARRLLMSAD